MRVTNVSVKNIELNDWRIIYTLVLPLSIFILLLLIASFFKIQLASHAILLGGVILLLVVIPTFLFENSRLRIKGSKITGILEVTKIQSELSFGSDMIYINSLKGVSLTRSTRFKLPCLKLTFELKDEEGPSYNIGFLQNPIECKKEIVKLANFLNIQVY